ncbi:hypothetical protein MHBO_002026 [Bonamia ostreae]|uniref:Uncharacterized protein n=1 Tax=Bonamia ostreae TaxID=126728 RepID=A0ABV2AM08_9EUKA
MAGTEERILFCKNNKTFEISLRDDKVEIFQGKLFCGDKNHQSSKFGNAKQIFQNTKKTKIGQKFKILSVYSGKTLSILSLPSVIVSRLLFFLPFESAFNLTFFDFLSTEAALKVKRIDIENIPNDKAKNLFFVISQICFDLVVLKTDLEYKDENCAIAKMLLDRLNEFDVKNRLVVFADGQIVDLKK